VFEKTSGVDFPMFIYVPVIGSFPIYVCFPTGQILDFEFFALSRMARICVFFGNGVGFWVAENGCFTRDLGILEVLVVEKFLGVTKHGWSQPKLLFLSVQKGGGGC